MPDTLILPGEVGVSLALAEKERRARMAERKEDCEQDLLSFIRTFWHCVEPTKQLLEGWVLDAMCDVLMAVTDGHLTRVIINVFPGAMKSLMLNVFWPAWEWGPCNMPHLRYLSGSYSDSLPKRDNGRLLRILNDPVYRLCWGDRVEIIRESEMLIENSRTGWKRVVSVHGSTAGQRGDRMLIDDPNNPNDVESELVRDSTNLWLREVMPDRLNDLQKSAIVLIQHRTHAEDATATLVEHGGGYTWISIPMEFDPLRMCEVPLRFDKDGNPTDVWRDPRGLDEDGNVLEGVYTDKTTGAPKLRMGSPMAIAEGDLAWPERFSPEAISKMQTIKGEYAYANQYQQMESRRGGGVIRRDWWQLWTSRTYPELGTIVVGLDTAIEENQENDYNAVTIWGAFAGQDGAPKLLLLWAWRDRLPLAQLVERVGGMCRGRMPNGVNQPWRADYLLIEHKTRGRDVHDEIRRQFINATWQTYLVKIGNQDKVSRLKFVSPLFSGDVKKQAMPGMDPKDYPDVWSGGLIYAPNTVWADDVINEVSAFPRGAHDDYVDSVSLALGWIRRNGVVVRKVEHEDAEREAKMYRKPMGVPYAIR